MSRFVLCYLWSILTATACLLVMPGFTVKSTAATLLASFEQPLSTTTYANTFGPTSVVQFDIGYASATGGVFDGRVFASSIFNFTGQPTTTIGAGFPALQLGIIDGVDDAILIKQTVTSSFPGVTVRNQTLTESLWISGGTTGLPGPDLGGFTLSDLVLTVNSFSFQQTGTSASFTYGFKYELLGEPLVAPVPLPMALPLFAGGLGLIGLLGWRRKRTGNSPQTASQGSRLGSVVT